MLLIHVLVHVGPSLRTDIARMVIAVKEGTTIAILKTRLADILAVARERIGIHVNQDTTTFAQDWNLVPSQVTVVDTHDIPSL